MSVHVFDLNEKATHELVAQQLYALARQLEAGELHMAYEEWHPATVVVDPIEVTVDLKQKRHTVELHIDLRWPREPEDG